jgi:hypothetical protein
MIKLLLALLLIVLGAIVIVRIASPDSPSLVASQVQTEATKQQRAKEELEQEHAVEGAIALRKAMRNPDSFKLESVHVVESGAVCYQYRAQNGFGGTNLEFAVLPPGAQRFNFNASGWNAQCAHKPHHDQTWAVQTRMGKQ